MIRVRGIKSCALACSVLQTARGSRNVTVAVAVAGLLVATAGCGLGEAHFQNAWKGEVLFARAAVQEYWAESGMLPESLEDVSIAGQTAYSSLVQYRKDSETEYCLWTRREDLARCVDNEQPCEPMPGGPDVGDIVGTFHVDGRVLTASWRSMWS